MGALLLDVGLGDDLSGKVEPLAEVVKALGGEAVRRMLGCVLVVVVGWSWKETYV